MLSSRGISAGLLPLPDGNRQARRGLPGPERDRRTGSGRIRPVRNAREEGKQGLVQNVFARVVFILTLRAEGIGGNGFFLPGWYFQNSLKARQPGNSCVHLYPGPGTTEHLKKVPGPGSIEKSST